MEKTNDIVPHFIKILFPAFSQYPKEALEVYGGEDVSVAQAFMLAILRALFTCMTPIIRTEIYPCMEWLYIWDMEYDEYRKGSMVVDDELVISYFHGWQGTETTARVIITKGPMQLLSDEMGTRTPITIVFYWENSGEQKTEYFDVITQMNPDGVSGINIIL